MLKTTTIRIAALALLLGPGLAATASARPQDNLSGKVQLDGSSTVFPISEAVAEEFGKDHRKVRVTVGLSGTGGGFKKFCQGDTDINDASRPIKESEEQACAKIGVNYIELPVAFDGISIVVNPQNTWCKDITVDELKRIWQPASTVKKWSDIRADWPAEEIRLYGPDTDSGTFDYFTEEVVGQARACRPDYTASADDNVLVAGVSGDKYALGYFGFAYYAENTDKLKAVPVNSGSGPVMPTLASIGNGSYTPLARPIFIYVSTKAYVRPEVKEFVRYYLANAKELVKEVGYVPLPNIAYGLALYRFERGVTGSVFNKRAAGASIEEVLHADLDHGRFVKASGSR